MVNNAMDKLEKNPGDQSVYQNEFLKGLQGMVENMGKLLTTYASQFTVRAQQHGADAKALLRKAGDAVLAGDAASVMTSASAAKTSIVSLSKAAAEASTNTDNDQRKKMIGEAQNDVKDVIPEFLTAAQNKLNDPQDREASKVFSRALRNAILAIDDVISAVNMTFRDKVHNLSRKTERNILYGTDDMAEDVETFRATPNGDNAKGLVVATARTVQMLQAAAKESSDPADGAVYTEQAELLRANVQRAIVAAKTKDADPAAYNAANDAVLQNLQQVRHTITHKDGWGLSQETETLVLNATKETALADKALTDAPAVAANAARFDRAGVDTLAALRTAHAESKDPRQRQQIAASIASLQRNLPAVQTAAKALASNPNDPHAQANLAKANDELLQTLREARRAVTGVDETPLETATRMRVMEETGRVERIANKTKADAAAGNAAATAADRDELLKAAAAASKGLAAAGEESSDPVQKVTLLQSADAVSKQADELARTSVAAAANPSDKAAQDAVAVAHDNLTLTLRKAQAAANMDTPTDPLGEYAVASIVHGVNHTAHDAHAISAAIKEGQAEAATAELVRSTKARGAKMISSIYEAAATSGDAEQRALLIEKAEAAEAKLASFERAAMIAVKGPKDAQASKRHADMGKATDDLMHSLNEIRHAIDGDASGDSSLSAGTVTAILETTDAHAKNIDDLRQNALNPNKKGDEVTAAVVKVQDTAGKTCSVLDKAIEETKDPVQKAKFVHGRKKVAKDSERMADASAAVAADPTNQEKRKKVAEVCEESLQTLREVRSAATGLEEGRLVSRPTERNVLTATADLSRAANRVQISAMQAGVSKEEQASALLHLQEASETSSEAILAAAAEMPVAERRAALMASADKLQAQAKRLEIVGRKAQTKPGDAGTAAELEAAKSELAATIQEVRKQVSGKTVSKATEDEVLQTTDDFADAVQKCRNAVKADAPANAAPAAIAHLRKATDATDAAAAKALAETTDPEWKATLTAARSRLRPAADKLAAATEAAAKNKGDPAAQKAVDDAANDMMNVLRDIRYATTGHKPNNSATGINSHISDEARERVLRATDLQAADAYQVTKAAREGKKQEMDRLIAQLAKDTDATRAAAAGAATEAQEGSMQRAHIIAASAKAAESSAALQTAAKAAAANPSDHAAATALARAADAHDTTLRDLRKAVAGDAADAPNLSNDATMHVTNAVADTRTAVGRVVKAAGAQGSKEELAAATTMLKDSTAAAITALHGAAAETANVVQKQKLLAASEKLRVQSEELAAAAAEARAKPTNELAQQRLENCRQNILKTLEDADEAAGMRTADRDALAGMNLEEAAAVTGGFLDKARKGQVGDNDLVAAAAEAAQQALQLCEMARSVAEGESPEKKAQILDAVAKTERSADELLNAMRVAAAYPNDVAAAKRLDEAYTDLNNNVQRMVGLCYSEAQLVESGLADALKAMSAASQIKDDTVLNGGSNSTNKADSFGAELIEFLSSKFLRSTPKTTRDYVGFAQQAAADTEKFLKELDEAIAKCDDPVYKETMKKQRRTIKDRVIQLKILATSKANSSDVEEAKAALSAATNNIVGSISEAMNTMHAASLRNRFKKAVNTAVALSKAVKGFKGMMKKKK